jgi:hypothetical protein
MGILGNPKGANDSKIQGEVAKWNAADTVKSNSSIHYIAVTAQGSPGKHVSHACLNK